MLSNKLSRLETRLATAWSRQDSRHKDTAFRAAVMAYPAGPGIMAELDAISQRFGLNLPREVLRAGFRLPVVSFDQPVFLRDFQS